MKWNNRRNSLTYLADLKVSRGHELDNYYQYVVQIANTFTRDSAAIGILDSSDLIQAGNVGLIEAWEKVDWELIEVSPNPQGQLWSFLKKRIRFAIRREIDNNGTFIKVPRRQLEDHRKDLTSIDKILVSVFPKFFDRGLIEFVWDGSSYENERLGALLDDIIYNNIHSHIHQAILKESFGLDTIDGKAISIRDLANKYNLSEIGIKKIKQRSIDKIRENPDTKIIIENFYNTSIL